MSDTKKCMRSGQCCNGYLAFVPKHEHSDISPAKIDTIKYKDIQGYLDEHMEPMGDPCKWLERDTLTSEATCLAHTRKASMCIDYPENIGIKENWCGTGLIYWSYRKKQGLPIPEWVAKVLIEEGR